MAKISSYGTVGTPALTDKIIGTETGGSPANVTKNFTLAQLQTLFGETGVQEKNIKVTPAQVLTAAASPVQLLPAVAATECYDIISVMMFVDFNTTAYDIAASQPGYIAPDGVGIWCQIEEDAINSSSKRIYRLNYNMNLDAATSPAMNKRQVRCNLGDGIQLSLSVNPTQGDSNLYFKIKYRIISTNVATDWT